MLGANCMVGHLPEQVKLDEQWKELTMDEPVTKPGIGDDEVNLMDYLLVIAKHSRMIIFTTMAMTVLTFLILFISPNRYTATARLMPPQQNMTLSAQILDTLSVGSSSLGGGRGYGWHGRRRGKSPGPQVPW